MKNKLWLFLIVLTLIFYGIAGFHFLTGWHPLIMMIIAMFLGLATISIAYGLISLINKKFRKIPAKYIVPVISTIVGLFILKLVGFGWPVLIFLTVTALGISCCSILFCFLKKKSTLSAIILGIFIVVIGLVFFVFINQGSDPFEKELSLAFSPKQNSNLDDLQLENPAVLGPYQVKQFTYGSGKDVQRKEYAEGATYITNSVNGKWLIPDWKGKKKKWRERYWEFGHENFPLNGRVYMPEGKGTFPLVLIVHGNHNMIDYSDDGYGYLGSLFASRGFITVSVDENFLNGHWSGDFRGKEMPARAWLLLKHLEQWQSWNSDKNHELANKVDMNNIMLVGHSRGGEAVSIAAAYNKLPYFPDNAKERFDFNFHIKGVVAIAPTDYRYHRKIRLKNLNFLSIQGSYDSDEVSFWGMRAYRRLTYNDTISRFKSGVYIHHANHGQFNSTWGNSDFGAPSKWLLNLAPLLEEKQQQEAAKVFISAFAEATLKNNQEYTAIFKNAAFAKQWLPKEQYLTHFESSDFKTITDFEEDININTARDSTKLQSKNLALWREENLSTRDKNSQENNAVVLGWDKKDSLKTNKIGSYEISLSEKHKSFFKKRLFLQFALGAGNHAWLNSNKINKEENVKQDESKRKVPQLDFNIQLTDEQGQTSSIKISDFKEIPKPLKTRFTKFEFLDKEMIGEDWEVQLQTYHLSLKAFTDKNVNLNLEDIRTITFLFDETPYGVLVLDEIGLSPK
ncbi:hypothetical protein [Croceitalea rosinachiae]|uniref:Chlorophyllase-like protein n=1 Tax=Croceitalea rosinachiae TaxID=3075596 RepID=A0ABU3A8L5_9FLAO|nr:hypothetical protein [Croceitalea sp. F388]MDT0606532.1 hypothetical protein [Croceitalea sp. F388]